MTSTMGWWLQGTHRSSARRVPKCCVRLGRRRGQLASGCLSRRRSARVPGSRAIQRWWRVNLLNLLGMIREGSRPRRGDSGKNDRLPRPWSAEADVEPDHRGRGEAHLDTDRVVEEGQALGPTLDVQIHREGRWAEGDAQVLRRPYPRDKVSVCRRQPGNRESVGLHQRVVPHERAEREVEELPKSRRENSSIQLRSSFRRSWI